MDKKISIILVAMLCLSMFPWASIGVGSEAKNAKNAEPLKVDAWVESKLAKPGDTIEIYAETSYTEGVSVSADIAEIYLGDFDDTEDWLSVGDFNDTQDYLIEQYVATISLTYDNVEEHWVGTYIIPSSAGGVYVADVTATDGTNTVNDNATVHLQKFYDEHLKPVQDNAETFLYGEFNDTLNDIEENLTALNDTINAHGGIRGIVKNLTGLPEWQALLAAGYQEHEEITSFLDNLTKFILSDEYETITSMIPELKSFILGIPTEPDMIIDYLLGFNLTHYLEKMDGTGNIIETYNLLMSSDEYLDFQDALDALQASETNWNQENLSIAIMELFMSDEMLDLLNTTAEYLQGNNTALQNLINSFAAVQNDFNSQLEALMDLPEFNELINASKNNPNLGPVYESVNTTFNNIKNRIEAMINSTQLQNLNESIQNLQNYTEGNYLYEGHPFTSDEAFDYNYTVKDWVKEPYLDLYPYFKGEWYDKWDYFEADKTFQYNYTVKDWVKEIHLDLYPYFDGYWDEVNETWVPGTGNITVTLTDPNGVVYTYTEAYNGSEEEYWMFAGEEKHDYTIENPAPGDWTIDITTSGGSGDYSLQIYAPGAGDITVTLTDPNGVVYTYTEEYNESEEEYEYEKHDYTILFPAPGNWTVNVATSGGNGSYELEIGPKDDFGSYLLKESMEELFFVFNAGIAIETEYFQEIGTNGSAKLIAYDANGRIANEEINVIVSRNTGGMGGESGIIPAAILYVWLSGLYEEEDGGIPSLFEALPYIKQLMEEINSGIVYEAIVTTDSNGEATINFPVEEFGIYTIDAYFDDENKIGFGENAFIGEPYVPEIGLEQIGKFAGIPVYMNPNKIGENITFNVNIPEGENASVGIAPMPLDELFPEINMNYGPSTTTITSSGNVSLQVNGPLSLIAVVTGIPSAFTTSSAKAPTTNGDENDQSMLTIPQFNISFGILLTSNVSVSLDVPNILKGEKSQIGISPSAGTPVITYGFGYYANGLDVMSLDVATLSTMAYESAVYQKEYNVTDVMESMKSIICGPGNTAFVTIPKLAVDGEYSFITFTNVDNTNIGTAFTSVNVYAEAGEIPAVTSSETVDNKDIVVTYVGSGEVIIKSVTVTPPVPPANVEHIGIFIDVDTTGTVHDAFITVKYNDSDVADVDESKLRMYYWNETTSEWVLIEDSGVWTNNNTVWARVTHFTIFAPMAEKTAAEPAPGIGWLIYVGVIGAVMIIVIVSLAATVKRKKKTLPPSP